MSVPKMRLLVVDDEEVITQIASFHLEERGFDVVGVNDPRKVRERMQHEHFDVVIVDYMMTFMNGLEVVKMIREELHRIDMPILMVTGKRITIPLREQCLNMNVVIFPKPFTGAALFQKVCDLLDIR